MAAHLEISGATIRVFDGGNSYQAGDPYVFEVNVTWIARDAVFLSAGLSNRPLQRSDLQAIKQCLVDHGVAIVYVWRRIGHKPPWPGRVLRELDNLAFWEMQF
jgi:hypothetical protein